MIYILIVSRLFLTLEKIYAKHSEANNFDFFLVGGNVEPRTKVHTI